MPLVLQVYNSSSLVELPASVACECMHVYDEHPLPLMCGSLL